MTYKYIDYPALYTIAKKCHSVIARCRKSATRLRRKNYNARLAEEINERMSCEKGYPVGMSAVHLRTVNLGNSRYFEPCREVIVTPEIVRFSDKCAFDVDGRKYLKSCILCYTEAVDREVNLYEFTQ